MSHVSACVTRCDLDGKTKLKIIKCQLKKILTLGLFSEVILSDIYTFLYKYVWKFNLKCQIFQLLIYFYFCFRGDQICLAVNLFLFLFSSRLDLLSCYFIVIFLVLFSIQGIIKTQISNSVRTTRFWNNLHQVRSKQKDKEDDTCKNYFLSLSILLN